VSNLAGVTQRVALVTGAGSGIGAATVRRLSADGFHVVAVGRRRDPLDAVAATCPAGSVSVDTLDVADTAAAAEFVQATAERHGGLHVVVNSAGTARQVGIADTTPAYFAEVIAVNLAGPAAIISAAWPTFERQGEGCIVNLSSLAQLDPFPGFFAYAPSKAGLHLVGVVANNEGAAAGIRAFTLAAGVVDTPLFRSLMPEGLPPDQMLEPDDMADVVADCIAGRHDDAAGQVLAVVPSGGVDAIQTWVDTHPGGGVTVLRRGSR